MSMRRPSNIRCVIVCLSYLSSATCTVLHWEHHSYPPAVSSFAPRSACTLWESESSPHAAHTRTQRRKDIDMNHTSSTSIRKTHILVAWWKWSQTCEMSSWQEDSSRLVSSILRWHSSCMFSSCLQRFTIDFTSDLILLMYSRATVNSSSIAPLISTGYTQTQRLQRHTTATKGKRITIMHPKLFLPGPPSVWYRKIFSSLGDHQK